MFATVGCLFASGEFAAASIRQKDDAVNAGVGGLLVGAVPGILKKNARLGVATSVLAASAMTAATFWFEALKRCLLGRLWRTNGVSLGLCRQSSQDTPFDKYAAAAKASKYGQA